MDLEIVGRHALLFDDDATAEVVNSGGSLVPWAALGASDLLLDRHDVRHLLDRVPPRPHRAYSAAILSAPSSDGVSEAELDRERYLDLPAADGGNEDEGSGDAAPSGNGKDTRQSGYNSVPFSYGSSTGSDDPDSFGSYYHPSFYVPESLLNKLPPPEKAHQIIARTALFVSEHGGQSEIVLRVKQGNNPTFGFLMPDHNLHSYFRYLVDHPQLLKDGADAVDTNKSNKIVNFEGEHASSGGALSLLGTAYESGDEDEDTLSPGSKGMDPGNSMTPDAQGHVKSASTIHDDKELGRDQSALSEAAAASVKSKPILMKKNPVLTGNSIIAAQREEVKDTIIASTTAKSENTNSGLPEAKEMILEPPSFMKRTMEKIIEFILRNGKEFETKLIEQDRTTGRFPFLLSSNPYHSYYLKFLQETQEIKSRDRSPDRKGRRGYSDWRDRSPSERDDRSSRQRDDRSSRERDNRRSSRERDDRRRSRERDDRRSSMEGKDSSYGKEGSRSNAWPTTGMVSSASDRSSAGPSEKQLHDQQGKGVFHLVSGVKKEPYRKVTADEAAAIVMAATRGLGSAKDSLNTIKGKKEDVQIHGSNDHSSSFGSFSSLQDRDAPLKHISNSEADASLTSSGQPKKEGFGIIDDDWIANTIAKAAAVAASKEADSSEASMTKEQKLKAERLRRAKMFAAIIKSGENKMNDLAAVSDPTDEPSEAAPADMNASGLDPQAEAKEREGSSAPIEHDSSNMTKQEKDSDDEQNRVRKYRKKRHQESDEEEDESDESYKHSRKRHRSEHSRSHSKDVHKHKHKSHSKDRKSRHRRHQHSSSEDEHEHRSSKSRHRHRDDDRYSNDEEHSRSRRHRREHRSSSKRKHEEEQDQSEQAQGRLKVSPSTSGAKFESDRPPGDTAQSSQGATEVPSELRAKIRAMLLETL